VGEHREGDVGTPGPDLTLVEPGFVLRLLEAFLDPPAGSGDRAGHWLLTRRSISEPNEIAYYVCYGPHRCGLYDLAWVAEQLALEVRSIGFTFGAVVGNPTHD
jgi:hypothetical protein